MIKLSNSTYDTLKYICQVVIPALGTLYFALGTIWGPNVFPYAEQVVGSLTAIDAFMGVLLKISSDQYKGDGNA